MSKIFPHVTESADNLLNESDETCSECTKQESSDNNQRNSKRDYLEANLLNACNFPKRLCANSKMLPRTNTKKDVDTIPALANQNIRTRFLIISDFSADREPLQHADVAIHCGDLTEGSELEEFKSTIRLLQRLNAPLKLVIAGNHDFALDQAAYAKNFANHEKSLVVQSYGHYGQVRELFEEAKTIGIRFLDEGSHQFTLQNGAQLTVFASPFTPSSGDPSIGCDWADQFPPSEGHQYPIPAEIHVAITHGPPRGIFDLNNTGQRIGCPDLFRTIAHARPRLHCFGHVHRGWGARLVTWKHSPSDDNPTHFSAIDNAASVPAENLAGLAGTRFDTLETLREKAEKLQRCVLERCCRGGYCSTDANPLRPGAQTLFVNAAIKGVCEELPVQIPWLVDIELPRAQDP